MKKAFTLAEVLITLAIIGVVSAVTIPTLVRNYQERQHKVQATNFQRKLGEALRVMNAQNNLRGFSSTKEFLDELGKNFKIIKVCENPTDCFVDKIIKQDGNTIDVSTLTTSESLGHADFSTEALGVQFANGVTGIIAYNKFFKSSDDSDVVNFINGTDGKLKTVSLDTGVISLVYDISGYDKPNTNGEDILGINTLISSDGECKYTKFKDYCVKDLGTSYAAEDCTTSSSSYCTSKSDNRVNLTDYWAGAQIACNEINMSLASTSQLQKLYYAGITDELGLLEKYWMSQEYSASQGYYIIVKDLNMSQTLKSNKFGALCIAN